MKLLSFRYAGEERFGPKVKKEEAVWDLIAIQQQLEVLPAFPASLIEGIPQGMEFVEAIRKLTEAAVQSDRSEEFKHSFSEIEWLPPISKTPKNILCVGKNYADHAKEMGAEAPVDLVVFTKAPATISADGATVSVHSDLTDSYDYEGELAVVIGKAGHKIPKQMAYDYVFGYTIANDLTARDLQDKHQQYFLGKSLPDSCPLGPYIVTKDEIPQAQNLSIVTKVNDEVRQNGNTEKMIRRVDELVAEISKYVALEPGDVLLTGTPAGVGKGFNPPKFLKAGDTIKVSIESIGTLVTHLS
ncbi:fumarylacetoacetate hydrolase family protein [Microbacterium sp. APC 3898]|uniref:Fumarylacetoacetate hydrolase family protein n=2 Tax=Planococcus TaxID=1372 RepID=A0ABT7ZFJ6_9BACL|nr:MULTISPECIES: fumarylacetoacetate hydrolase family protein [Terrabacteria group]MBF6632562.1 fumarylacetoacetate hydrolase family protein [Planococcus sp. (in: firmicutes)]MBD8013618.1 fumarylacetoacetate hydrolase family protein [Planococcus wigleyi]MDN3425920.1 fumarylacetoacetate hydrolase family protein [Planococcus sp. APC 4016]MDN3437514.1 fumarylacetoacetate hydrolase family protein [Planococcus sp. APC 3900]MDN3497617.1 fumarylacetoacetate hydrolase family protein [Microbacterium sp